MNTTFIPLDAATAKCRTAPDRWYGDSGDNALIRVAKEVCRTCPLVRPCAEHGIRHEQWGVWGALTADERKKIRNQRGIMLETPLTGVSYPQRKSGPDHGDEAGYARHVRRDEKPCQSCYQGHLRARQDRAKRQAAS